MTIHIIELFQCQMSTIHYLRLHLLGEAFTYNCCVAHVVLSLIVLILIVFFTLDYDTCVLLYADYSRKPDPHTPHFMDRHMERRSVPLPIPVDQPDNWPVTFRESIINSGALQGFWEVDLSSWPVFYH